MTAPAKERTVEDIVRDITVLLGQLLDIIEENRKGVDQPSA
jgi:hypothetical protein